ncbi:hypothetical protein TALC_00028 [Thermoplasmatales archaeon BRNA1]|nr:hypothetical protein TALC_00028 [Thermoplasmatales archaeon BRNA1]
MSEKRDFLAYLSEAGVHPWLSDIASRCLSRKEPLDPTVLSKMQDAFDSFAPNLDFQHMCQIISDQGYPFEAGEGIVKISHTGGSVTASLSETSVSDIVFRRGNIVSEGERTLYPLFAAGMLSSILPSDDGIRRQSRIEYHWPDGDIPGR